MAARMMTVFLLVSAAEGARAEDEEEDALTRERAASEAADIAPSLVSDPTEDKIKDVYGACPEDNAVCVAIRMRTPQDSSDCEGKCGQVAGRLTTTLAPGKDEGFPNGCGRCVEMDEGNGHKYWAFDLIFPYNEGAGNATPNEDVYLAFVKPTMSKAFACSDPALPCQSAAFFAYGATGSGKSFTMGFEKSSKGGLMQRGVGQMFRELQSLKEQGHALGKQRVYMAFYEVYGGTKQGSSVFDLLGKEKPKKGATGSREKILSSAIHFKRVDSLDDMMGVFGAANDKRAVGGTGMNAVSSRSHAVVTFYITDKDVEKLRTDGPREKLLKVLTDAVQIMFVDLAGSEPAGDWEDKTRQIEGTNINQGLSRLRGCIQAAAAKAQAQSCQTRGEMLVEMLKSLFDKDPRTGRAKAFTRMIATFNPSADPKQVKLSKGTMIYASKMKSIKIETPKGKAAGQLVKKTPEQLIAQLTDEVATLTKQVEDLLDDNLKLEDELEDLASLKADSELSERDLHAEVKELLAQARERISSLQLSSEQCQRDLSTCTDEKQELQKLLDGKAFKDGILQPGIYQVHQPIRIGKAAGGS